MTRLFLDVSSLVRWSGPPVGIARAEYALAHAALRRPGVTLVVLDRRGDLRELHPRWQDALVGWSAVLDLPGGAPPRRGWRAWVPSREPVVAWLERCRLTRPCPVAALADLAQRAILAPRAHGTPLWDGAGGRIARVPPDLALGATVRPGDGDVVFSAGFGWAHGNPAALARARANNGFRHAVLCYDLIPLTHARFWLPEVVEMLRAYWLATLPIADLVVTNARCVAADLRWFARERPAVAGHDDPAARPRPAAARQRRRASRRAGGGALRPVRQHHRAAQGPRHPAERLARPAGARPAAAARLPDGLRQPRGLDGGGGDGGAVGRRMAGHRPAPERRRRRGAARAVPGGAFCLYPSAYEGFGLPIIEAFAHGKAVLASDGGAVPETVGDLSPCLPAGDVGAWEAALAAWIADPAARAPWEARIAAGFAHPDWDGAADAILDAVTRSGARPGPASTQGGAQAQQPQVQPGAGA